MPSPIIATPTLCAQGFLQPFEKESLFVAGMIETEKKGKRVRSIERSDWLLKKKRKVVGLYHHKTECM